MNALDTNILVRFFFKNEYINEDYKQHLIAVQLLKQDCFISLTVILETVWVLSSRYKLSKDDIYRALMALCRLNNISIEKQPLLEQALSHYINGMDFADALHLVQSYQCSAFYTFDQKLIKKANTVALNHQVIEPR
ncbi:type II toxin-antitoxin system VapC family toxin [Moraxella sp. ZY210820]|uniref:type II toxin-antitoxin system VapC family toxin n=1 Tax=unclassified Moraxella TaxID=2685852 RepID=UPI002730717D|nr:type II toxin-antitoxin system VapC family toxin [Moraxella sp. ZY210820]WLF83222.1 type II toxin-antitoxin system VapC family toxin [Moraxella sp. ZY210820]